MVTSDPGRDRERLERDAHAGDTHAMFRLAVMLMKTDPGLARQWFERAAEAGVVPAMANLGFMYSQSDPGRARQWYERAAQAGDAYAQGLVEASHLDRGSYGVIFVADRDGNVIGPWYLETNFGLMVMIFGDMIQLFDAVIYTKRNFKETDRQIAVIKFDRASPAQVRTELEEMEPTTRLNFVSEGEYYFGDLLGAIRKDNAGGG
jgi:TPR repeat protein